ncbi:MAG TPA: hypothetical protein VFI34_04590 [Candidatus Limnocylindrales bacterium]|nr:hypothetical protein [Candidatus Limnocylindrales bacterium]
MTTLQSTRRARRGSLVRSAVWLSAAAMLATAAFAPATTFAANPTSMDVACNNIIHGGRSPEYVWTTVGDAGVTAGWATDAAHFDAANHETVTVRVCVADADGADHGAIDQNTENDGTQLFPWSVLGYAANPCPDSSLSFGSSVDSPAVQTKKSNLIACPADDPTDEIDQPTDGVDQPTDGVDQPTDGVDQPTDGVDDPTDGVDDPTDGVDEPTDAVDQPTDGVDQPTDGVDDPTDGVDQPTDGADQPTQGADDPSDDGGAQPTGAVEGAVGTPGVTPPPTDTIGASTAPTSGNDGWRMVLAMLAAVLVGTLVFTTPKRGRRQA